MSRGRRGSGRRMMSAPQVDTGGASVIVLDNARRELDPVLGFATGPADYNQGGTLTGLTPTLMGQYLNEFYNGTFTNVARVWEVFERRDDACTIARRKLRRKVLKHLREYQVVPFDDSPEAERQAEFLRGFYRRVRCGSVIDKSDVGGLRKLARFVLDAVGKQYSLLAKDWQGSGPDLSLHLRHVPLWFFGREKGELQFSPTGSGLGNAISPDQWLTACTGEAVMEAGGITCLCKRMPLFQLVNILEKWGTPHPYATTTEKKGSAGWNQVVEALGAIVNGWSGVVSEGTTIDELKATVRTANLHTPWIERCDNVLYTLWQGSHLGTRAMGDTGSLAGGAQQEDTNDLVSDLCDWLTETFRDQLDGPALEFGLGVTQPKAGIRIWKPDEADDKADLEIFTKGAEYGVPISVRGFQERFGTPVPENGEDMLIPPAYAGNASLDATVAAKQEAKAAKTQAQDNGRRLDNAAAGIKRRRAAIARERRDLDQLYANSLQPLRTAMAGLLQPVLDRMATAPNLARAADLADDFKPTDAARAEFAKILAQIAFAAAMRGFEPIHDDIPLANSLTSRARRTFRRIFGNADAEVEYAPLPFDEAETFWKGKTLVVDWEDIGEVTFDQAVALGFKVAGVTEESILRGMYEAIDAAIKGESTVDELIAGLTDRYGLNATHAETVARTNIQSAYQWGHAKQLLAVTDAFPWWGFDVVLDDDTSDICEPLAGTSYRSDDPVFDSLYPPNHYRCRTTVYPLSSPTEDGFKEGSGWPRDPESGAEVLPHKDFSTSLARVAGLDDIL